MKNHQHSATQSDLFDQEPDPRPLSQPQARRRSAFDTLGFRETVAQLQEEVRALYTADHVPWIIGYSGGKDSTATLQLIWTAIAALPSSERRKPVHVISTDTLVENPIVSAWVGTSLDSMQRSADAQDMPFEPRMLRPKLQDRFWVNLIGKGYAAPRHKFRWCTERLKITPSTEFIQGVVSGFGETILALGTRKAESARRAATMNKHEKGRVRDRLSPNSKREGMDDAAPRTEKCARFPKRADRRGWIQRDGSAFARLPPDVRGGPTHEERKAYTWTLHATGSRRLAQEAT